MIRFFIQILEGLRTFPVIDWCSTDKKRLFFSKLNIVVSEKDYFLYHKGHWKEKYKHVRQLFDGQVSRGSCGGEREAAPCPSGGFGYAASLAMKAKLVISLI